MQNEVEHKQGYHTAYVILFTKKKKISKEQPKQ